MTEIKHLTLQRVAGVYLVILMCILTHGVLGQPGASDPSFVLNHSTNFGMVVNTISVQPDDKIIIAGRFNSFNGVSRGNIARINNDGSLDDSFNPGTGFTRIMGSVSIRSSLIQPNGKLLIGGFFDKFNGTENRYITRLNSNGSLDANFDTGLGPDGVVTTIAQLDEKILLGGNFTTFDGIAAFKLVCLNEDGSRNDDFVIGNYLQDYEPTSIAVQGDGKIVVGSFACCGVSTRLIARLNEDGTPDSSFDPGTSANSHIYAIKLQPDGKILVGGDFTFFNSVAKNRLVRLNVNGSIDSSFGIGSGANGTIRAITVQDDGKIIIIGSFTSFNGISRNGIVRLNANGSVDSTFDPGTGVELGAGILLSSITLQGNKKALFGGDFSFYNGNPAYGLVRVLTECDVEVVSTTSGTRCGTGSVALSATSNVGILNWYASNVGGSSVGTGTTFNTPGISATTSYYAEAVNAGCVSPRSEVTATINVLPSVTSTIPAAHCGPGSLNLEATASDGVLNWYEMTTGGSSLGYGTVFTTSVLSATTTYYVAAENDFCKSERTAVMATVVPTTPPVILVNSANPEAPILSTSLADSYQWFKNGEPTGNNQSYTVSSPGVYHVQITTGGCPSEPSELKSFIVTGDATTFHNSIATIHPNPTSDLITISLDDFDSNDPVNIYIVNLSGQLIRNYSGLNQRSFSVDVSAFPAGRYAVVIRQNQRRVTRHFLKMR